MFQRIIIILLMSLCTQAKADAASDKLLTFFSETQTMRAEFVQTIQSKDKKIPDENRGVLTMQRPGKFVWDYQYPYQQQIIADGKQLWIYDVDLDQAIVKPLDMVLGDTPAVLLSGTASVTERFKVEQAPELKGDTGLDWLRLAPKKSDIGFEQILLAFKGTDLQEMHLTDAFGQVTRLVFSNLEKNPKIDASLFNFVPPDGVDVIRGQNQ